MNITTLLYVTILSLCAMNAVRAASVTWNTSPGILDTEVSTRGTALFAYYFNPNSGNPPVAIVNTVPFTLQSGVAAPLGLNFNGSYNFPEGVDLYQVPLTAANAGLNQILDGQNWGAEALLTVTGLTPGRPYELQFMISDDRAAFFNTRNYDVSDSVDPEGLRDIERAYHSTRGSGLPAGAPPGSIEAKIFTGNFIADASGTQDIFNVLYENVNHTGLNSGSQVNAIQVRVLDRVGTPVPEALSPLFGAIVMAGTVGAGSLFRRYCKNAPQS